MVLIIGLCRMLTRISLLALGGPWYSVGLRIGDRVCAFPTSTTLSSLDDLRNRKGLWFLSYQNVLFLLIWILGFERDYEDLFPCTRFAGRSLVLGITVLGSQLTYSLCCPFDNVRNSTISRTHPTEFLRFHDMTTNKLVTLYDYVALVSICIFILYKSHN